MVPKKQKTQDTFNLSNRPQLLPVQPVCEMGSYLCFRLIGGISKSPKNNMTCSTKWW